MFETKEPQEIIAQLVDELNRHAVAYYVHDNPTISDAEYDRKYSMLKSWEESHPQFILPESPTQRIVGRINTGFQSVHRNFPMLSISTKTSDQNVVDEFCDAVYKNLERTDIEMIGELKYDGLAVDLKYDNGLLVQASTRGNGYEGEDVTDNVKMIRQIPVRLHKPDHDWVIPELIHVRGEIMMTKKDFKELNQKRAEQGLPLFANPRNAAAGTMRQLDSNVVRERKLIFRAYGICNLVSETVPKTQSEIYAMLAEFGIPFGLENVVTTKPEELQAFYDKMLAFREAIDFDIDGIIYKVNRLIDQEQMGYRSKEPRWAVAHKFPAQEEVSRVNAIDVQIGRTGRVTPVARITPTFVGGTTVSNITLHNLFDVRRKKVRVGRDVFIRRAGDVIPEIVTAVPGQTGGSNFWMPKTCPACGGKIVRYKGETNHYCVSGVSCPAQRQGRFEHYVQRRAMNIDGLGEKIIETLIDEGMLQELYDIYTLKDSNLNLFACVGKKVGEKLLNAIEESKKTTLTQFIYALGIEHVGETTAGLLADEFGSIGNLIMAKPEQILTIPTVGPETANSVFNYFSNEDNVEQVMVVGSFLEFKKEQMSDALAGKTFVLTGSFANGKADHEKRLKALGAKVSSSVSKTTTTVVFGPGAGEKYLKAQQLNVPTIDEIELLNLLEKHERQVDLRNIA